MAPTYLKPAMLLHACCAPCSTHVIDILREEFALTIYFYDPNIHPVEEYIKRRDELKGYAVKFDIPFLEGPYDAGRWFELTGGHEDDKEGSGRCFICYEMRLRESARFAGENGFEYFATVLSVSPRKDAKRINESGKTVSVEYGIKFLEADFKKKDGFKRSVDLSRKHGLYRQNYCGCVYSMRKDGELTSG